MTERRDSAGQAERPTPAPRARKGADICFQCRNRKVRCDGAPGGCENCKRLHFECSLSETPADSPDGPGGRRSLTQLERRRVRRACIACRDRKSKCTGSYPSCVRCLRLGIGCQYPSATRQASYQVSSRYGQAASQSSQLPESLASASPPVAHKSTAGADEVTPSSVASPALSMSSEPNISKSVIKQHIDAFFDFVYPIPCHGFLHRATLLQSWAKGTLNPRLLRALCGVTTRFVFRGDIDKQHQARAWIHEAEMQLLARLGEPRMSDVEAWMLVTLDHILSRRFGKMLVSMCLTSRLAYILRLNHEEERLPFLIQERRRRLMWSIFVMDTLYSSGRAEFMACPLSTIHLRLPCNERSFSMDVPVVTEFLSQLPDLQNQNPPNIGLMAYCLRVLEIRDRTHRLSLAITNHHRPLPECLASLAKIEAELAALRGSLPQRYQFDQKNFFLRAYTPSRTPFLMLHAWWHQTHCDLFRFAVPGLREGLPAAEIALLDPDFAASCRAKCLANALAVSRVLETAQQAGVDLIPDPSLAMCAFHSARIIARLGPPPMGTVPKAELLDRLAACAGALEEQSGMYPTTGILRGGILDLIHDVQRQPRDGTSSPMRNPWEPERGDDDEEDDSPGARAAAERGEVYSKYSVTDYIRKLKFREEEDGEEVDNTQQTAEQQGSQSGGYVPSIEVQPDGGVSHAGGAHQQMQQQQQYGMAEVPMNQPPLPLNPYGPPPDTSMGYASTGYDALTVGFDPRYQSGQPDMFMDSFWPLPAGTGADWTMLDMEHQM